VLVSHVCPIVCLCMPFATWCPCLQTVHRALDAPSSAAILDQCMGVVSALAPIASLPTAGLLFRALVKVSAAMMCIPSFSCTSHTLWRYACVDA
jgi:hypothetical protein